jgi:hypothetical protein
VLDLHIAASARDDMQHHAWWKVSKLRWRCSSPLLHHWSGRFWKWTSLAQNARIGCQTLVTVTIITIVVMVVHCSSDCGSDGSLTPTNLSLPATRYYAYVVKLLCTERISDFDNFFVDSHLLI